MDNDYVSHFNKTDLDLYGEKILKIRNKLSGFYMVLCLGNYGCYLYHDDNTGNDIVISQMFSGYQYGIEVSNLRSSFMLYKRADYDYEKTINYVIAQILYEWLAKDNNAQQTINDYAINEIRAKNEPKTAKSTEHTESKRKRMYRTQEKFFKHWMVCWQNRNESEQPKRNNASQPYNFIF